MGLFEAFRMAWGSLRGHKTRSALTLLGMVIGVFAIIVSVTAVQVIDVYFKEKLQFLGSSTVSITKAPQIQIGERDRSARNRPNITYAQVERLEEAMQLPVTISPMENFSMGKMVYQDRETEPSMFVMGTNEDMLGNFSYEVESGRFFTSDDIQYARPVCVLGSDIAKELFPNENPIRKVMKAVGKRCEVIGVLKSKGSFLGFSQDNRLYIPITTGFTGTLTAGGAGIGLISLFAAGIGIMNIMLVSVTERTREIGVRKSVGARRRDIMRQFLFEAFFLCQIGGILGILLGAAVGNGVAVYFEISATFPTGWAIAAVLLVTGIALVFGGYPAFKAARLNPIDSLRYE